MGRKNPTLVSFPFNHSTLAKCDKRDPRFRWGKYFWRTTASGSSNSLGDQTRLSALFFKHMQTSCKKYTLWAVQKRWCSLEKNYKKVLTCVWEGLWEYFSTSGAESLHVGGARQIDKICNLKNDLSLRSINHLKSSWLREQHMETDQGNEAECQHSREKLH